MTPETVHLHIFGPDGLEHGQLIVGKDIPEEQYRKLVDVETGALYALKLYEDGVPKTTVVSREIWEKAKEAMDSIDREAIVALSESSMGRLMEEMRQRREDEAPT